MIKITVVVSSKTNITLSIDPGVTLQMLMQAISKAARNIGIEFPMTGLHFNEFQVNPENLNKTLEQLGVVEGSTLSLLTKTSTATPPKTEFVNLPAILDTLLGYLDDEPTTIEAMSYVRECKFAAQHNPNAALLKAASAGDLWFLKLALSYGVDVEHLNRALILASYPSYNQEAIIATLLTVPGINLNYTSESGSTALDIASVAIGEHSMAVHLLKKHREAPEVDVQDQPKSSLAITGTSSSSSSSIQWQSTPDGGYSPAFLAAPTAQTTTTITGIPAELMPLFRPWDDNPEALEEMLRTHSINPEVYYSVRLARLDELPPDWDHLSEKKRGEILEGDTLLQRLANHLPDARSGRNSLLLEAARCGDIWLLRLALKHGAKINYAAKHRGTVVSALMLASYDGHTKMVSFLLTIRGVDVNQANRNGETALMFAAQRGHVPIVTVLLGAGAMVDLVSKDQETALLQALERGHTEIVTVLLAVGADVHQVNSRGFNALMFAAKSGNVAIVTALLAAAPDIELNCRTIPGGYTALDLAKKQGHGGIVVSLKFYQVMQISNARKQSRLNLTPSSSFSSSSTPIADSIVAASSIYSSSSSSSVTDGSPNTSSQTPGREKQEEEKRSCTIS